MACVACYLPVNTMQLMTWLFRRFVRLTIVTVEMLWPVWRVICLLLYSSWRDSFGGLFDLRLRVEGIGFGSMSG